MPIPKLGAISRTYRHVNRYRQILTVVAKYGFGEVLDRMTIGRYVGQGLQWISRQPIAAIESHTTAQRVRMMLEELGPTFVKLGQVLSTRPDLIPPEFADELAKLQRHVPPFEFDNVRQIVEQELGASLDERFARFDREPLAAASIGQVHRARLPDGREVVVKVQRPGIRRTIEVDLEILQHLAELAERHVDGFALHKPTRIVEEFARVLERELDFTAEAAHLERFARLFEHDPTVRVPRVHREATTSVVLTMEYVDGIPVTDLDVLRRAGVDPRRLAAHGTQLTLKQLFVFGFFHADPHPGNIFALPGDVVCLLDFGMMGRLDRQAREDFADLIYAVAQRDAARIATSLLRMTEHDGDEPPDVRALERDAAEFVDVNIPAELRDLDFSRLVQDLFAMVARHRLRIAPDLVTMLKAATTVERVVARLDPDLNVIAAAEPYVRRLKIDRMRPRRVLRELVDSGGQLIEMLRDMPDNLRELLRLARRGGLRMGFEHRGLDDIRATFEQSSNRVAFAIVVGSLIVGSSLIMHARLPPLWNDVPLIGLIGYLAAGVMGVALLLAIVRHGKL